MQITKHIFLKKPLVLAVAPPIFDPIAPRSPLHDEDARMEHEYILG